jgi:hypothetical protein
MNRKQKVLTVIALIAFVVIGTLRYVEWPPMTDIKYGPPHIKFAPFKDVAAIHDVRTPWFMLSVIYVGLFFLLADKKEKP